MEEENRTVNDFNKISILLVDIDKISILLADIDKISIPLDDIEMLFLSFECPLKKQAKSSLRPSGGTNSNLESRYMRVKLTANDNLMIYPEKEEHKKKVLIVVQFFSAIGSWSDPQWKKINNSMVFEGYEKIDTDVAKQYSFIVRKIAAYEIEQEGRIWNRKNMRCLSQLNAEGNSWLQNVS
ncbi:hypothetical protein BpHYR1_026720 [Brachionus plicatilis]|uniref:Uncharacterized protein n=1 Tax=Brachionus plicatilis TaxID=10195 RepID=A0A3M7PQT7_BRAPC|nr:hypothetical protein BpHYR1_026720 [Brachionus plicatilis]